MELLHDHRQAHGCLSVSLVFLVVHPSPPCTPGLAHKTKHEMAKHLALFASLGRFTLSLHIFARGEKAAGGDWNSTASRLGQPRRLGVRARR